MKHFSKSSGCLNGSKTKVQKQILMIRNISYNTRELTLEINEAVGKPFSIFTKIKLGGNGSQRFVIFEANKELEVLVGRDNKTNFCNIELREKGIILRFRSMLETFAWIIPYHILSIFKSDDSFSIFAGAEFVRLKAAHNASLNHKFIHKLLKLKSEYLTQSQHIH